MPPTNGMISYDMEMGTTYEYQAMATYSCAAGFTLSGGDTVRTCEGSSDGSSPGAWSGKGPICEGTIISILCVATLLCIDICLSFFSSYG